MMKTKQNEQNETKTVGFQERVVNTYNGLIILNVQKLYTFIRKRETTQKKKWQDL